MSYFMTHLIIADKYFEAHCRAGGAEGIADGCRGDFLLGSVAPDAVHMRPDYAPEMKARSHMLPDGIRWGGVRTGSQAEAWRNNIVKFYQERLRKAGGRYRAFIMGYTMHMLTDAYNSERIFGPAINASGLAGPDFMKFYRQEAVRLDDYLYYYYDRSGEIFGLLEEAEAPDMPGLVASGEIAGMVRFYHGHYKASPGAWPDGQKIFDLKTALDFIDGADSWIEPFMAEK